MSKYYLLLSVEAVALLFQQSENFNLIDVKQCLILKNTLYTVCTAICSKMLNYIRYQDLDKNNHVFFFFINVDSLFYASTEFCESVILN